MHRYVSRLFAAVVVTLVPAVASAQEEGKVGITMGFPETVGLVWHATPNVAVRPEVSFSWSSSDQDLVDTSGTVLSTGVSALFYVKRLDRLATYVSPRYSFRHTSTSFEGPLGEDAESRSRAHLFSGSFGAQYWLGERFSLFGELGLAYVRSSAGDEGDGDDPTANQVGTRSAVGVVFYF